MCQYCTSFVPFQIEGREYVILTKANYGVIVNADNWTKIGIHIGFYPFCGQPFNSYLECKRYFG